MLYDALVPRAKHDLYDICLTTEHIYWLQAKRCSSILIALTDHDLALCKAV